MEREGGALLVRADDRPVGLLVPEPFGFTFHAGCLEAWALDRKVFPSVTAATREAERLLRRI
ncbi:hypothetical protein [Tistlia consotensis]|uniref:hypothetical protein n=1 Tax=Tistlia consotensis TaxID=1321365 RepID=UPI00117C4ECC|nr:hypothetical protein [Tistlia consotensis]